MLFVLLLTILLPASGWPSSQNYLSSITSDPTSIIDRTFDYVIVGGGLAGLTVAGRLSEDPTKTVLVIEAGNDDRTNQTIYNIYEYGVAIGTNLTWSWDTEFGRSIVGGRTLGGSSSINAALWTRGTKEQYDAPSQLLGDEDVDSTWNFDSLFSYMKKSEGFTPPDKEQRAKGANSINAFHGFTGPVQVAFPEAMFGGPQQPTFINVIRNKTGIRLCEDLNGGDPNCVSYVPQSINPHEDDHRSSSAEAYLTSVENRRPNWVTLVGHQATQLLLSGTAPNVTASGVQFKRSDNTGEIFTVKASRDVILAAGGIGTPQLLQLSGIGDPSVLTPLGIDVKVSLLTVGRNLQEQTKSSLRYSTLPTFDKGGRGPSDCLAFPSLKELFSENAGSNGSVNADEVASSIMALYPSWAESQSVNALNADALKTIFGIQADLIVNRNAPILEFVYYTNLTDQVGINMWPLLPFSRGNVTIVDRNVFTKPKITVNYFNVDFDLSVQTAGTRLARKVLNDPAFSMISSGEINPGTDIVPDDGNGGTDSAWHDWILAPVPDGFSSVWHEIATAAMMRRELGGVVDGKVRVYDTTNLRVVDASILPIQVSAHLSSTLYGIAEKAADIIKSSVPFNSSFKLPHRKRDSEHDHEHDGEQDRGLTLLDIVQGNVPNGEFAFLSACHTAEQPHDGVLDEVLHLSAAMQFSGFRSVIGSLWELLDKDGLYFAKTVYEYMWECDEVEVKYTRAAAGLRKAAVGLKERDDIRTERWVNLVHIGA